MQTTPIGLKTFEGTDKVLKEDFNDNFNLIDTKFGTSGHKHSGAIGDGPKIDAANITVNKSNIVSRDLASALSELFTDASGKLNAIAATVGNTNAAKIQDIINYINQHKQTIINYLISKGISTPNSASLQDLVEQIKKLAVMQSKTTATAYDVLSGKTFISSDGITRTGLVNKNGSLTIDPAVTKLSKNIPGGYYTNLTIKGDANLVPENIRMGATVLGVAGEADSDASGYKIGDRIPADYLDPDDTDQYGNPISYLILL